MTVDFITALFYEVDEQLCAMPKHPEAHLWPSEVVTLGLLHALKGVGNRVFTLYIHNQLPSNDVPVFSLSIRNISSLLTERFNRDAHDKMPLRVSKTSQKCMVDPFQCDRITEKGEEETWMSFTTIIDDAPESSIISWDLSTS